MAMHLGPSVLPSGLDSPAAQGLGAALGRERVPVTVRLAMFRCTDGYAPRVDARIRSNRDSGLGWLAGYAYAKAVNRSR